MTPRRAARALLFLLALASPAVAATGPAARPIENVADLDRYLAQVAPGESPLDRFSPAARRRFLAAFREGRPSTGEIAAELTREEGRAVLALFGLEAFLPTRLRAEHLAIGASETREASTRFDAIEDAAFGSDARKAVVAEYRRAFAPLQTPSTLRRSSDGDIALAFRAAAILVENDPGAALDDLTRDLAELERRGVAAPAWIAQTYATLLVRRDVAAARAFREAHPDFGLAPPRDIRDESNGERPTVLAPADDGTLIRRALSLDEKAQVIVVAGCHFSKDAAEAIERDPVLRALFSRNTTWITPAGEDPADPALAAWNHAHPLAAMATVYRESEWPAIDSWAMPTFYFLRDGKLRSKVVGWAGHRDAVLAGYREIGLAP